MAVFVATDFVIEVATVDLTDHITQAELPIEADAKETTAFGGNGWRSHIGGLKQGTFTLTFNQDYAASEVDATLWPILGTVVACTIKPTSAAISATNPQYQFNVLVNKVEPVKGNVGDLAVMQLGWPVTGAVTRDVTA